MTPSRASLRFTGRPFPQPARLVCLAQPPPVAVGMVLTDPLRVSASVDRTSILGAVDTVGELRIDSADITLAANVTTTGSQIYGGAVGLVGSRVLAAGSGDVTFGSTVDSSPELFADPDAFTLGTALATAFPGITLSAAGKSAAGVVVTSQSSDVKYPDRANDYAPTGTRVFAGQATDSSWGAPDAVLKAAFAAAGAVTFASSVSGAWARTAGGLDGDFSRAVATFADGSAIVTGVFENTASLGSTTLTSDGDFNNSDIFVARLDAAGNWTTPSTRLAVSSKGTTRFGGVVSDIASLSTDAGGATEIAGGQITALTELVLNDDGRLLANATLGSLRLAPAGRIDIGTNRLRIKSGGFDQTSLQQAIAAGIINAASAGKPGTVALRVDDASGDAIIRLISVPDAPATIAATPDNGKVSLSWPAPVSNGRAEITDYVIQFKTTAATVWSTFSDGTSTNAFATVTGLTNGTAYVFRVLAVNAVGRGAWSAVSAAVTHRR